MSERKKISMVTEVNFFADEVLYIHRPDSRHSDIVLLGRQFPSTHTTQSLAESIGGLIKINRNTWISPDWCIETLFKVKPPQVRMMDERLFEIPKHVLQRVMKDFYLYRVKKSYQLNK